MSPSQQEAVHSRTHALGEYRDVLLVADSGGQCTTCGAAWGQVVTNSVQLHGLLTSVTFRVQERKCSSATCTCLSWSGDDIAIFRHSAGTCFTYELHRDYLADVKGAKCPSVNTHWSKRSRQHLPSDTAFIGQDTYRAATWSLFKGIDMNYETEFTCDVGESGGCGSFATAPVIIGDGKALVCQPGRLLEEPQPAPQGLLSYLLSAARARTVSDQCSCFADVSG